MSETTSTDYGQCSEPPTRLTQQPSNGSSGSTKGAKSALLPSDGWHSFEDKLRRAGIQGTENYRRALINAGHLDKDPLISKALTRLEELVEKGECELEAAKAYRREWASELAYLRAVRKEIDDGSTLIKSEPSMRDLARDVCRRHDCTLEELRGGRRHKAFVRARQEFCYLAYKCTNKSLPLIGRYLKRDHTTVLYSILQERERRGESK